MKNSCTWIALEATVSTRQDTSCSTLSQKTFTPPLSLGFTGEVPDIQCLSTNRGTPSHGIEMWEFAVLNNGHLCNRVYRSSNRKSNQPIKCVLLHHTCALHNRVSHADDLYQIEGDDHDDVAKVTSRSVWSPDRCYSHS